MVVRGDPSGGLSHEILGVTEILIHLLDALINQPVIGAVLSLKPQADGRRDVGDLIENPIPCIALSLLE